ncbi:unnamed protein product [Rhizophagus irregularis]|nr:unnamed protein product [Rhizophagus irregularis]
MASAKSPDTVQKILHITIIIATRKRSKSSSKRSTVLSILVYNQKFNDYGIMIVIILCTYIVIITSRRSSVVKFTISNKL